MNSDDYVLGEDVTELARPLGKHGIVLSIRIDIDMLSEIERLAIAEDRTLSFIARRALRMALGLPALPGRYDDVMLTDEEGAELEKRLATPISGPSRPARAVVVLTETPPWLTSCSGTGHNFFMPPG